MPTILRLLNWHFHFYSDEGNEPAHVHVDTGDGECEFWLSPVVLARANRIKPHELRDIEAAVMEREAFFLEKWHEFFGR